MSQDQRFDIIIKKSQKGGNSLCLGYFPNNFKGSSKTCLMELKDDKVKVKEETQKIKRVIKLGKIVEENVGSMTNNYEGTQIGGSNPNQVILFYENKHF